MLLSPLTLYTAGETAPTAKVRWGYGGPIPPLRNYNKKIILPTHPKIIFTIFSIKSKKLKNNFYFCREIKVVLTKKIYLWTL